MHRVVVTGMGAVSSYGRGRETLWNNIMEGRSGIKRVSRFDPSEFPSQMGAEITTFDPTDVVDKKTARKMDRFVQFAVVAAAEALADSGLEITEENAEQVGVILGTGIGGIETFEDQVRTLVEKGPNRVSPFFIPMMIVNMAAGQIAIQFGAKGRNETTVTACASSSNAIAAAFRALQHGEADAVITGGTEAVMTPVSYAGFSAMKALSTRNEEPEGASRPFDRERDGFVMGEGAGILILETYEHAVARGAEIYGEVVGAGMTADAYHIVEPNPEGEGGARAMKRAMSDARLHPTDIGYVNAHGTSTPKGDLGETMAIHKVFGDHAKDLKVSSTKSMTGHLLGAAGALEAIICLLALRQSVLPPTINLENPGPGCDLDYVPLVSQEKQVDYALSNSFGFGGHNVSLIFARSGVYHG